ncbi:McrC family protein [Fusobacterium animalis]|uniref:Restriction endonuclease n=1 Tax=Fusobacterium animalis TaxID=76859 RepID=A0A0M5MAQ2_9FUSO|nr:hypothetical protein [Fusobacterium animalis]ALF18106.1 hypothetical protein RN98_07955 [Fusobacterium animalis]
MKEIITIREYEKIGANENFKIFIDKNKFKKLKDFIKANNLDNGLKFFKIYENCIIPQNFIGTINVDNISIEIFSKIPLRKGSKELEKERFLEILEYVEIFNENIFEDLEIGTQNMPILEIFISNFVKEIKKIVKKGLVYSYTNKSENILYFRGKLDLANHIKYNIIENKFFMNFDEFSVSSIENCLIKLALEKVKYISTNIENKEIIYQLLVNFEDIDTIGLDPPVLFNKIIFNRKNNFYKKSLDLAKFFLLDESPYSIFCNDDRGVTGLFFPMETIYESYIANKLRQIINKKYSDKFSIRIQDNSHRVFDDCRHNGRKIDYKKNNITFFRLIPDIILESKNEIIILDTKWKELNNPEKNRKIYNYNISHEDIYQLITYIQIYQIKENKNCKRAYLIYPINNNEENSLKESILFKNFNLEIGVYFVDLSSEEKVNESLESILNDI